MYIYAAVAQSVLLFGLRSLIYTFCAVTFFKHCREALEHVTDRPKSPCQWQLTHCDTFPYLTFYLYVCAYQCLLPTLLKTSD